MREYAILYSRRPESWAVIFKDFYDNNWSVLADDLSEDAARLMLRGAEAENAEADQQ